MGKTWVLSTETKGTGATKVPLESVTRRSPRGEPLVVPPKPQPRPQAAPEPRPPRRFKVVDVMTRETMIEGAGAREAIDVLKGVRSSSTSTTMSGSPNMIAGGCSRSPSGARCGSWPAAGHPGVGGYFVTYPTPDLDDVAIGRPPLKSISRNTREL